MESYAAGRPTDPDRADDRGRTSRAPSPRTASTRRSSSSPPDGGGPTPSSTATSTPSPAGSSAAGIQKGDRVGVWAPNCAEWTIVQYATAKVGAILVNVNPAYRTHEFSYAVNQSGLRLLISATEFKTSDYREMVEEWSSLESPGAVPSSGSSSSAPTTGTSWSPRGTTCRRKWWPSAWRRSTPTTRSTSSTRAARPATPRAPR